MKRMMTFAFAVLTGLLVFAVPAMAEVSAPYGGTDVGGSGGTVVQVGTVSDPAAVAGGALAQTGFDLMAGASIALLLVVAGALVLAVARRRSARAI